jgi:hypothetical protein
MRDLIVVCPFDEALLANLREKAIVIETRDPGVMREVRRAVHHAGVLHAVWLEWNGSVSELPMDESWRGTRLVVLCSGMGSFKDLAPHLPLLRNLEVTVLMRHTAADWSRDLQILSSVGIPCGLKLDAQFCDWQQLNDCMHYALYCRTQHAPIQPFYYVASEYDPQRPTDFESIYFNSPERYIHINAREEIALTREDLLAGLIIATGIDALETIKEGTPYKSYKRSLQKVFLDHHPCAYCSAWRICLGKFPANSENGKECESFFRDFMDAVDFYRQKGGMRARNDF